MEIIRTAPTASAGSRDKDHSVHVKSLNRLFKLFKFYLEVDLTAVNSLMDVNGWLSTAVLLHVLYVGVQHHLLVFSADMKLSDRFVNKDRYLKKTEEKGNNEHYDDTYGFVSL